MFYSHSFQNYLQRKFLSKLNMLQCINLLQPGVAFLYPPKTSENFRFSDVFSEYRKATLRCNGLNNTMTLLEV